MKRFAKLFEVSGTQVLFTVGKDEDGDLMASVTTHIEGTKITKSMCAVAPEGQDYQSLGAKWLDQLTEEHAQEAYEDLRSDYIDLLGPLN